MESPQVNGVTPLPEGFNFTPILNGVRVRMRLSETDFAKIRRGPGLYGTVTDLDDGQRYKVYGRSCGAPHCMCDAEIKPAAR